MQTPGALWLLQIDHLSGEEVGHLVERLYTWGARNVHVVATLTKKSRPGQLVWIDASGADADRLARGLAREFGVTGHHRLDTTHCHEQTTALALRVVVHCADRRTELELPAKRVGADGSVPPRLEHAGLVALCERLHEDFGVEPSLPELRRLIETRAAAGAAAELRVDPVSGRAS